LKRQAIEDSEETPEKKLCLLSDGTRTFDYSLGPQKDVYLGETFFTTVTYRKKRPGDIPIVFKSTKAQSFWQVNPNRIRNKIVTTAQEKKNTLDRRYAVSAAKGMDAWLMRVASRGRQRCKGHHRQRHSRLRPHPRYHHDILHGFLYASQEYATQRRRQRL
ncbi:hypothetical protein HPB47_020577, partial [Ixodes persulcatus]